MICEICGGNYNRSCIRCTRRVATWGENGTLALIEMAKESGPIHADRISEFIDNYYIGKSRVRSDRANVLKTALGILGYDGGFVGRIHKNKNSYLSLRRRENMVGRRWRLRNDKCDYCGSDEDLHLHHIVPLSWGGISSKENCLTLCQKCHMSIHKKLSSILNRERLLKYIEPYKSEIDILARSSLLN